MGDWEITCAVMEPIVILVEVDGGDGVSESLDVADDLLHNCEGEQQNKSEAQRRYQLVMHLH